MIKVSIEGLPREIAALIDAIQEQQRIREIRRKHFEDMTTKTSAHESEPFRGVGSCKIACGSIGPEDLA